MPGDRVKTLLGKLHSITSSQIRGSKVSKKAKLLFNKFVKQVENILKISLSHWNGSHFTFMTFQF